MRLMEIKKEIDCDC